jgi:hypothetical protein
MSQMCGAPLGAWTSGGKSLVDSLGSAPDVPLEGWFGPWQHFLGLRSRERHGQKRDGRQSRRPSHASLHQRLHPYPPLLGLKHLPFTATVPCRGVRTSGTIPGNCGTFCARLVRMEARVRCDRRHKPPRRCPLLNRTRSHKATCSPEVIGHPSPPPSPRGHRVAARHHGAASSARASWHPKYRHTSRRPAAGTTP